MLELEEKNAKQVPRERAYEGEIPTMRVLMQLDTPPCFKQQRGENFYAQCPTCCTCLCPVPPRG